MQIALASILGFLVKEQSTELEKNVEKISCLLASLIRSLRNKLLLDDFVFIHDLLFTGRLLASALTMHHNMTIRLGISAIP